MSWGRLAGDAKVEGEVERARRATPPGRRLQDQFALVTGAGRGFGSLIAVALAQEGAHVALHYHQSAPGAEKVAEQVRQLGRRVTLVRGDIRKWADVKAVVENVWEAFGRLDLLVNNVGDVAWGQMSWREITEEAIDRVLAVDIKGTLFMTHEVGQRMLAQKHGVIVNVCSNVVVTGSPRAPQYAASKYGVIGLTKSYALAFAPWVRVNALGPGYMDTESTVKRPDWTPERRKWVVDHTPLRRIAKPEDIVPIVLFLASDDSVHMTGNFVVCDGGFSMPAA
jgi:3-oxoacyl-[acyl-carrier protein] reductase